MVISRTAGNHEAMERAVPIFPGDDLRIMKEFYVDRLGFRVVWEDSSSDGATGIMGLERGTIELVIAAGNLIFVVGPMEAEGTDDDRALVAPEEEGEV